MESIFNFVKKYKYLILSGIIILIMILGSVMVYLFKESESKEIIDEDNINVMEEAQAEEEKEEVKEKTITIDIKGEVNKPGVYELPVGSRVIDQTCPIMIQRLNNIFQRNPLISIGI